MCSPLALLFYLICIICVSHAVTAPFASSVNGGGDLQSLFSIKSQISKDPFGILSSWNNSFHFCNWPGISCDQQQQKVMGLNLSDFQLTGTLSSSIGNLSFLEDLNIANNSFTGSIPQEISKLNRLQNLLLSNNSFRGEIPRNFTYLLEISVIDLHMNMLSGPIPTEIGVLHNLVELHISQNNLIGKIPETIGNLSALKVLSLSYNNLGGIIPQEFGKLSNLQILQLASNELTGSLPLFLHNITTLQQILLASNDLSGFLPSDFGLFLPNLHTFYIGNNRFSGLIPASIANASELEVLDFSFNSFHGQVPMDLGNIKHLNRLDFSYNSIGDRSLISLRFMTSLTNCSNLGILSLHYNNLTGVLPTSIANLSNTLLSLTLDGNYIYGEIPGGLENLKNLVRFRLSQNSLTGTIPDSIGKLTGLQELNFSNNMLNGVIPSNIGNLTLLSVLDMQQNMLTGRIPASLSNCVQLLRLDLSRNKLIDAIPSSIFSLSSLTTLSFAQNSLSGSLPVGVGKMTMLTNLDVSDNILTGILPESLGSCVSLEVFDARANFIEGTIPLSLGKVMGIQFLDLSSNNLVGTIPVSFASFAFIQFLNLSSNSLDGEVPNKGLFRNISTFSITQNRDLCGGMKLLHLPDCPNPPPKNRKKIKFSIIMVIPAFVVVAFMSIAYVFVFYYRKKKSRNLSIREPMYSPLGEQYPKISYTEIRQATNGFSTDNLIAMGRYSSVYKGVSKDYEQGIAIKVINLAQSGARRSFVSECEALKHIRHRNLVKIITACSGTDFKGNEFKALVYGFMNQGNLDSWLHPIQTEHNLGLDFIQRLSIAIDVASALVYLHHSCETPIIHRDIKPSNVLLDDDFCAHLGDFGSARSLLNPIDKTTRGQIRPTANEIVGTVGYIALEYSIGAPVSTLVDVYSYGILLLEMFTAKRPTDNMFKDSFSLHNYVKMAIPDQVMSVADPQLVLACEIDPSRESRRLINACELEKCLGSVFRVGVVCSAHVPRERMEISSALIMLQTILDSLSKR